MNIYLRLPTYVAQYWRTRFTKPLEPQEPVILSEYDIATRYIRDSLVLNPTYPAERVPDCFSHLQWQNICRGKNPYTGAPAIARDHTIYPTYEEVSQCCGMKMNERSQNYDYLCIQMPSKIFVAGEWHHTNASYGILKTTVGQVQRQFLFEFRMALREWEVKNKMYCLFGYDNDAEVIDRTRLALLERFMLHHNIYCGKDETELRAIRKEMQRILADSIPTGATLRELLPDDITFTDRKEEVIKMK